VTEPSSPTPLLDTPVDPKLLREAFEQFIVTSRMMERAYHELQAKVQELGLELEEKNRQLSAQLAATERAHNLLSDVLASLDLALVVFDDRGRVSRLNHAAQELFQVEESEALGATMRELFERRFAGLAGLRELTDSPAPVDEIEIGSLDGPVGRVLRVSTHRMRGAGAGCILLAEDVTEVVHRRAAAERNQRLAAMGEMAVQVVHQIRNPMGSIELFASMLKRDLAAEPDKATLAEKVQQGIRSLNLIIGNLLSFAKGAEPMVQAVDCGALADQVLAEMEPQLRHHRITVEAAIAADASLIRVDPELWRQVMMNLIVNAIQAMPSGGTLRLEAARHSADDGRPATRLTVADTGHGMPPAVRERIFDPFFTTKERGTGLGLALVYNIVKAHGAAIEVESGEGQGSVFTITLPG
jgi:signal transduction histidine kinase